MTAPPEENDAEFLASITNPPKPKMPRAIKAKKSKPKGESEDAIHMRIKRGLTDLGMAPGQTSRHGVFWCSHEIRNSGRMITTRDGKTINLEGMRRKARGVVAGIPDLQFIYQGRSYWIELKNATGARSYAQQGRHIELENAGCLVAVCRSLHEVLAQLAAWGVPTGVRF